MKAVPPPQSDVSRTLEIDGSSRRRRRMTRWLAILVVAVAVVAAVAAWMRTRQTDTVQYETQEVRRGELRVTVTATGTLQPTNTVDVSSELSGIIKSVEADYNDRVKVGQVLIRLDTSKLDAQVMQSRAGLESANAKVLQAQATVKETLSKLTQFEKVRELSNNKVPSQSDLDGATAALERAQADEAAAKAAVSQAKATLDANETDLSKAVICSPINGIVLTRSVERGQTVAAALSAPVLFTLAEDLTQMELHVDVDEADVGQIQEGQEATFSVDAYPDRTFDARIVQARYAAKTVEGVVTYETVLKVDNKDLSLRPGMTATAEIAVKRVGDAVLVSNAALRFVPPVKEEAESSGNLVGSLLPHPPRNTKGEEAGDNKKQQHIWTLKAGQLTGILVTVGSTDGSMTEVVSGDVEPGMVLVVDIKAKTK
jgi:HlyD family secretion protein